MLSSLAAAAKGYLADKEQMDPFDFLNYMPPGYSNGEAKASIPKDVEENTKEISSKSVVGFPDENVVNISIKSFVIKEFTRENINARATFFCAHAIPFVAL